MKGMLFLILSVAACKMAGQEDSFSFRAGGSMAVQSPELFRPDRFGSSKHAIAAPYCALEYQYHWNAACASVAGLQYIDKGFRASYQFVSPGFSSGTSYRYELRYLELPLQFKYQTERWSLRAGFIFSVLLSNAFDFEESDHFGANYNTVRYSTSLQTRYRKFDAGICIGISRCINSYFELDIQLERGFIKPDTWTADELIFQEAGLIGLRYYFLKQSSFLAERRNETSLQH